jgi:hypothetical protein
MNGSDLQVAVKDLKSEGFTHVLHRWNSIPSQGSPCQKIDDLIHNGKIQQIVNHRNGEISIFTISGWFRFVKA